MEGVAVPAEVEPNVDRSVQGGSGPGRETKVLKGQVRAAKTIVTKSKLAAAAARDRGVAIIPRTAGQPRPRP